MAEAVAQITEVETRTLPTGVVIYVIKAAGKEYTTRDRTLAQEAYGAVGKDAHFDFNPKKNDRGFTNNYLNHLSVMGDEGNGGLLGGPPPFAGSSAGEPFVPAPDPFSDTEPEPIGRDREAERQLNINMATSLKEAIATLPHLDGEKSPAGILNIADYYMRNWFLGWKP